MFVYLYVFLMYIVPKDNFLWFEKNQSDLI